VKGPLAHPEVLIMKRSRNCRVPKSWAERAYHKLISFNEVEKGGHFAAWEQPELFAAEVRAAFKSLR
jgi:pimeloyl-ACP methyl ester carboxylesterase